MKFKNYWKSIIINYIFKLYVFFLAGFCSAAELYIASDGNDITGNGSKLTPWATFSKALSLLAPGDTLIVKNGIYNQALNIALSGLVDKPITIKAEEDGGAIISSAFKIEHSSSYIQIEGFKFDYPGTKIIYGNHIKIMRSSFKGGGNFGNVVQVAIGTNDFNDTDYILIEDCWSYGEGGRYNFLVYNSTHVILRRCLARHDGGWTDDKSDPEASFCVYNSSYVELQNCVVVDSSLNNYHTYCAGFYMVYNTASPRSTHHVNALGCMAINSNGTGFSLDGNGAVLNTAINNAVVLSSGSGGVSAGQGHTVDVANILIGRGRASGSWQGGVGEWGNGNPTIKNSIIYRMAGMDVQGFTASFVDRYLNGDNSPYCANSFVFDPELNGLKYPVRIESGSTLINSGENGNRLGPEIIKQIGKSGTGWGEADYNIVTEENLWPYPNENRIKNDMSAVADVGNRGFCSDGQTLTNYIWGYLENTVPPFNVKAVTNSQGVSISWDPPASAVLSDITEFRIYDISDGNKTLVDRVTGNSEFSKTVAGLTSGKVYKFAVTAVDKVKGESGYSYQVTAKEGETPVLNFSDITSGPNTGLNDGIGDGAIVTVWGNNLGCAKNDSKIYFKDSSNNLIPVEHVYYWKIADGKLPGGPADLYSSHQMQELAFSIPNTATLGLGKIFIEKDGVKSNELDFTVRTGPIFYVAFTGNDSAGDGSFLKPWKTFGYATNGASTKNSVIPGTIIYGVDVTELQEVSIRVKDGTEASPIALIAYPGKVLSIKNNTTVNTREGGLVAYNITDKPEFWVFSKWDVRAKGSAGIVPFNGGRIIGNAITDYLNGEGCADGAAGAICSTNGTSANAKIFGNYIHDWGCYNTSNQEHTTYFSIRNQGFNSAPLEFAWNNLSNNSARFGIHFYDEHDCWGYTGVTRIHDNFVLNQVGPGFNLGAMGCNTGRALSGDFDVYNNVFVNTGLLGANNAGFSAIHLYGNNTQSHVRIYNNTIYGYGYLGAGENGYDAGFCVDSSMGNGGSYNFSGTYEFINNIVVDTNNLSFVTKTNPKLPRAATNNIWYNGGDNIPASTPDWSLNTITSNPLFVNPSKNNFYLQQNSPAINSGSLSVVQVVTKDFIGVNRPYGQYFDIGAYEYTENEIIINFDINSDFQTNILDVQTFINHFIGTMVNPNADVNKDGVVNVDDLLILNNKILELDCGC